VGPAARRLKACIARTSGTGYATARTAAGASA
jgi:hypothetical protein